MEINNNTYEYAVLPPRKMRIGKEKEHRNVYKKVEDVNLENNETTEEVNSRIAKREQKKQQKNQFLLINGVCITFFILIFIVYCFGLKA